MKPTTPKRTRRLLARAATMNHANEEFDDYGPEPNMKLSHAFLVVLLLHVVAVGGLYAFNSMKASRQTIIKPGLASEKVAKSRDAKESPESGANPGGGPSDGGSNGEKPPSGGIAPAPVAKVSKITETTRTIGREEQAASSSKGLLASARGLIAKATGGATVAVSVAKATAQDPVSNAATQTPEPTSQQTYTVRAGDTLTRIAATLGVAIPDLEKINNLAGNSVLQVGQVLKVPAQAVAQAATGLHNEAVKAADAVAKLPAEISSATTAAVAPSVVPAPAAAAPLESVTAGATSDYTVVKGDNPWKIAKKFKISQDELMKANGITDPKKIQIGQVLKIPASTGKASQTKK